MPANSTRFSVTRDGLYVSRYRKHHQWTVPVWTSEATQAKTWATEEAARRHSDQIDGSTVTEAAEGTS